MTKILVDVKEIAGIIKKQRNALQEQYQHLIDVVSIDLANHLEREAIEYIKQGDDRHLDKSLQFNKQQFLKDCGCGVEK